MIAYAKSNGVNKSKAVSIMVLRLFAIAIILAGASFSVYSVINGIRFMVLNNSVPGVVFGLIVLFLGIRYLLSVQKLKAEVYKSTSSFSWSNFKSNKN